MNLLSTLAVSDDCGHKQIDRTHMKSLLKKRLYFPVQRLFSPCYRNLQISTNYLKTFCFRTIIFPIRPFKSCTFTAVTLEINYFHVKINYTLSPDGRQRPRLRVITIVHGLLVAVKPKAHSFSVVQRGGSAGG